MKPWQRWWLGFLIIYASIHLVRDVFQDIGMQNALSTMLVKPTSSTMPWFWMVLNTCIIAILEIFLAFFCLKRKRFGKIGYTTIYIAVFTFSARQKE